MTPENCHAVHLRCPVPGLVYCTHETSERKEKTPQAAVVYAYGPREGACVSGCGHVPYEDSG
jgi:hypothetical protein